ncbi:MAG: hypothetical protein KF901_05040 [Myxococcales bacterium]|nr:hypothetical protein [Myxococcales bacterium]
MSDGDGDVFDPDVYLDALQVSFPRLRVVHKERDAFSALVHRALLVVTFGAQRRYLDDYVTTIGQTLYLPRGWDTRSAKSRYVTLRHEAVHLRQFARLGLLGASLLYLLPVLPLGLAWGRARLEWEAYAETFRATAEVHGREAAHAPALRAHVRRQFTSGAYGWMWPFPQVVDRWIDGVLAEIDGEG